MMMMKKNKVINDNYSFHIRRGRHMPSPIPRLKLIWPPKPPFLMEIDLMFETGLPPQLPSFSKKETSFWSKWGGLNYIRNLGSLFTVMDNEFTLATNFYKRRLQIGIYQHMPGKLFRAGARVFPEDVIEIDYEPHIPFEIQSDLIVKNDQIYGNVIVKINNNVKHFEIQQKLYIEFTKIARIYNVYYGGRPAAISDIQGHRKIIIEKIT